VSVEALHLRDEPGRGHAAGLGALGLPGDDMLGVAVTAYGRSRRVLRRFGFGETGFRAVTRIRERMIDRSVAVQLEHEPRPGCVPGCWSCCVQSLSISSSEAVRLARAVKSVGLAREQIVATARVIATHTRRTRYSAGIACPLLAGGLCTVYEARPQPCRSHLSLSRPKCEACWEGRATMYPHGIPFLGETVMIGDAIRLGADVALAQWGAQIVSVELAEGVGIALADGAVEAWLGGALVFPARHDDDYRQGVAETMQRFRGGGP
jgi:Fe-S-cluster containining protein